MITHRTVPGRERWHEVKDALARALELGPAERSALLAGLAPEIAGEVAELLEAESDAGFLAAPALERVDQGALPAGQKAPLPQRIGAWRIEGLLGQGGMGAVYRAVRADGDFEQRVALKVVRPELAEPELERRFAAERRILAGLEHPNIARLVDGGTTAEGLSYLALELVDGEPLDVFANRHTLDVGRRLELFSSVVRAVEFAHRKLVLHRDLKPANILVDGSGSVKLLDFGIAKLLAPEQDGGSATQLSLWRPLTPGYASPEQLLGEELTTASDVYSLGVLLYELLTGRLPHHGRELSAAELARKIASADPPRLAASGEALPPGVTRAALSRDLDGIVAKALTPEPDRRYLSAGDLAADVECFLSGRAVAAHPPTWAYRARKFVKRHRLGTLAASAIALTLLTATAFSLQQARLARRERERALSNLSDLRRMANELIFQIDEDIRMLSAATPARERLVATALSYLEGLAREAGDDPTFLGELATAYVRIGELQGVPYTNNLGHAEEALTNLRRGSELAERATHLRPGDAALLTLLARARDGEGSIAAERGDTDTALTAYEAAIETLNLIEDPAAKTLEHELTLGRLRDQIAQVHLIKGDFDRAITLLTENLHAMEMGAERAPSDAKMLRGLYRAHLILGDGFYISGRTSEGLIRYRQADEIASRLAALPTPGPEAERDRFVSLDRISRALVDLGRSDEALPQLERELALTARMVEADGANEIVQRDRASALQLAADTHFGLRDFSRALAHYRESAGIYRRLAEEGNPRLGQAWAGIELHVGVTLARLAREDEALDSLERAETAMAAALVSDPDSFDGAMLLSRIHRHQARLLAKKGDYARAVALARRSLAATAPQRRRQPSDLTTLAEAADATFRLAEVLESTRGRSGARSEACSLYRESHELWQRVPAEQFATFPDAAPREEVARAAARCAISR